MAKQVFENHRVPLEDHLIRLATRGLENDGVNAELLRIGMRRRVAEIVNQVPLGMKPGIFDAIYKTVKGIGYGLRGAGILPRVVGELYTYDADDEELRAFKREFRIQVLGAQLGSRECLQWLQRLQDQA